MKQLLLIFGFVLTIHVAQSQVYVGGHRLDTLSRPFITATLMTRTDMRFFTEDSYSLDIGKGEKSLFLYVWGQGKIEVKSITDFLTIMQENGWYADKYQLSDATDIVYHIFIFRRRGKEDK